MSVQNLRIFGIYGPRQHDKLVPNLMKRIVNGQPVHVEYERAGRPDDGLLWTPCHVRDAVGVVTAMLERCGAGETLNVAGPEAVSVAQVARHAADALACDLHLEPAERTRTRNLLADTSRLRTLLPEHRFVPVAEGLAEVAAVLRRQLEGDPVAA
jgi:nucleoside-diphosphate-sugar epimerase